MTPRATVVIVNYNGAHLLPACLDGLRKQDLPSDQFQTVVVDNASADGSVELLRDLYPDVEVIASTENLGFAGGNNLALRQVDTPFAVLVNNDAIPDPGWLRALLDPFDAPHGDRLGATTSKTVFLPKFARMWLQTPAFSPGPLDSRQLGVRVFGAWVGAAEADHPDDDDGSGRTGETGDDVAAKVIWDGVGYGQEGSDAEPFWWTRPEGDLLVPVAQHLLGKPLRVTLRVKAEEGARKPLRLSVGGTATTVDVSDTYTDVEVTIGADQPLVDVINNVGGIVLKAGFGGDRGFRQVDEGQFDRPEKVFSACGNGMAIRTSVGQAAGWFDDDFFMYYEDVDLSWRIRSRAWDILYVPTARLRHIHSASSKERSPLWIFHVDRNRLLMLTKNATPKLIARALAGYIIETGRMALAAVRQAARTRSRPPLGGVLIRLRILLSYSKLGPKMVSRRRAARREAIYRPADLQGWLVTSQ